MSRRTIFRDLDVLREVWIPLRFDDERRTYHIPGENFLRPTQFTPEEALSLIVLCGELGEKAGLPFYEPAKSAAMKIESSLPLGLRDQLREISSAVSIKLAPKNELEEVETTYNQLVQAIAHGKCVRIRYDSFTDHEVINTRLSPYRLLFSRRSWYVIGRSSLHRAARTFNVGRILKLDTLAENYRVPRTFNLERYLGNAWHLIPEPGPDHEVVIRFEPLVAGNVAEVNWHRTQRVKFNKDGTLDFRVTVSGLNEISWWVLGYGDQAEVLKPPALRELIVRRCTGTLAKYDGKRRRSTGTKRK